jgi:hypothetical protein
VAHFDNRSVSTGNIHTDTLFHQITALEDKSILGDGSLCQSEEG